MKKTFPLILILLLSQIAFAAFPMETAVVASTIEPATRFHFGGFLMGFFLGIYGVVIAYLMNKKNIIRSAWWGFGVISFLAIALYAALIYSLSSNSGGYTYF